MKWSSNDVFVSFNPGPAEPRYALPLQTVKIQISWLLQKPTDLDPCCFSLLFQCRGCQGMKP